MNIDQAAELARAAIMLTLLVGTPIMLTAVIVGLVISILQAVTQVQDQTLSFVPKIIAMFLAALYIFPWLATQLIEYSTQLIRDIPSVL